MLMLKYVFKNGETKSIMNVHGINLSYTEYTQIHSGYTKSTQSDHNFKHLRQLDKRNPFLFALNVEKFAKNKQKSLLSCQVLFTLFI